MPFCRCQTRPRQDAQVASLRCLPRCVEHVGPDPRLGVLAAQQSRAGRSDSNSVIRLLTSGIVVIRLLARSRILEAARLALGAQLLPLANCIARRVARQPVVGSTCPGRVCSRGWRPTRGACWRSWMMARLHLPGSKVCLSRYRGGDAHMPHPPITPVRRRGSHDAQLTGVSNHFWLDDVGIPEKSRL